MQISPSRLPEILIIQPRIFSDERGFFLESYNCARFNEVVGRNVHFVQDNHSRSAKGVLRGLHYQLRPEPQAKLVRVVRGSIFDVAVDVREGSPTLGQWVGVELSAENRKQMWIPEGFAHGFLARTDDAEVHYKSSGYYAPDCERSIAWDDPDLAIDWNAAEPPVLSAKDAAAPPLSAGSLFR